MRFVVLDTNVVVSSMLTSSDKGNPAIIMQEVLSRKIVPVCSSAIYSEYDCVLHRKKFGFYEQDIQSMLALIKDRCVWQDQLPVMTGWPQCSDPDDQKFYDLASGTDSILITGNTKHFPKDKRVQTPSEFVSPY